MVEFFRSIDALLTIKIKIIFPSLDFSRNININANIEIETFLLHGSLPLYGIENIISLVAANCGEKKIGSAVSFP